MYKYEYTITNPVPYFEFENYAYACVGTCTYVDVGSLRLADFSHVPYSFLANVTQAEGYFSVPPPMFLDVLICKQ